jgi:hypothetical protein
MQQNDHSTVERIAAECADLKMYVVWWTYSANYSEVMIEMAKTPEEAFGQAFPFYLNGHDPKFRKYMVRIQSSGDTLMMCDHKKTVIGSARDEVIS